MARYRKFAHIGVMPSRPCRPSDDVKRLWRQLLPGTPFPACADTESAEAEEDEQNSATTPENSGGETFGQSERARGR